jgi:hypothetical protein
MAIVTISEAARLVGKDRRTVQRHVSRGKLSKVTRPGGSVGVDTSELVRVYGDLAAAPVAVRQTAAAPQAAAGQCRTPATPDSGLADELREAEARAARAEGERDALRERVEELRESEGHWRELAKGALRQIEDLRQPVAPMAASSPWRSWLPWRRRASGAAGNAGAA